MTNYVLFNICHFLLSAIMSRFFALIAFQEGNFTNRKFFRTKCLPIFRTGAWWPADSARRSMLWTNSWRSSRGRILTGSAEKRDTSWTNKYVLWYLDYTPCTCCKYIYPNIFRSVSKIFLSAWMLNVIECPHPQSSQHRHTPYILLPPAISGPESLLCL